MVRSDRVRYYEHKVISKCPEWEHISGVVQPASTCQSLPASYMYVYICVVCYLVPLIFLLFSVCTNNTSSLPPFYPWHQIKYQALPGNDATTQGEARDAATTQGEPGDDATTRGEAGDDATNNRNWDSQRKACFSCLGWQPWGLE